MRIRRPLRPLATIIAARERGQDPDRSIAEDRMLQARARRARENRRAEVRIILLSLVFIAGFGAIATRMATLATASEPETVARVSDAAPLRDDRADILDRDGRVLATNVRTRSLYAQPALMVDAHAAAEGLARIFPELDAAKLKRRFAPPAKFVWVKRRLSPEQAQQVHDLGEPGLILGTRQTRLFPNGNFAAHVLGGAGYDRESVRAADIVGRSGVERWFDDQLSGNNDVRRRPLQLSLDLPVQAAVRDVLAGGMRLMNAKGASAVLMDAHTGEVISLVSLPDFDPNNPPPAPKSGDPADSPLFNRAAQGNYELGSTYKLFTAAIAMETGIAGPNTLVDTKPLRWGKYRINEFNNLHYGPFLSLTNVLVKSSNIGSARLAMEFGVEAQKSMFQMLGLLEPSPLEISEASASRPQYPDNWSEISAITISYGHGISATPLHLAAAYASLLNGGLKVTPTLVKGGTTDEHPPVRLISERTSASLRWMLRKVVTEGTAHLADAEGYYVAGKTGTAVKPNRAGGYDAERVISNFAAVFPAYDPQYILVVTLDEPEDYVAGKPKRSAGWTAAPIAREIILRTAPILGMKPRYGKDDDAIANLIEVAQ